MDCALLVRAISVKAIAKKYLFFILLCIYVIHIFCRLGTAFLVEGVKDIAVDQTLQSFVSMYHLVHPFYVEALIHLGQFAFYLVDLVIQTIRSRNVG